MALQELEDDSKPCLRGDCKPDVARRSKHCTAGRHVFNSVTGVLNTSTAFNQARQGPKQCQGLGFTLETAVMRASLESSNDLVDKVFAEIAGDMGGTALHSHQLVHKCECVETCASRTRATCLPGDLLPQAPNASCEFNAATLP